MLNTEISLKSVWFYLLVLCTIWHITGLSHLTNLGAYSYNSKRIIECLFFLGILCLFWTAEIKVPKNSIYIYGIATILVFGFISAISSENILKSLTGYWMLVSIIATISIYKYQHIEETKILYISFAISIAVFIYIFLFYFYIYLDYSNGIHIKGISNTHAYNGFSNPRFLNQIQTWCLPILALTIIYIDKLPSKNHLNILLKYILIFSSSSYTALVIITEGRGTILTCLLSTAILRILLGRKFNLVALQVIKLWLLGLIIYIFVSYIIPYCLNITQPVDSINSLRTSDSGRITLWQTAIEMITNNPLFGVGPLMYQNEELGHHHPHNSLLWIGSELGIFACLAFFAIITIGLLKYSSLLKFRRNVVVADILSIPVSIITGHALCLSLFSAVLHSFLSGIYIMPASQLVGVLVTLLALANFHNINTQQNIDSTHYYYASQLQTLILRVLYSLLIIPAYLYMQSTHWGEIVEVEMWNPGFWIQGSL